MMTKIMVARAIRLRFQYVHRERLLALRFGEPFHHLTAATRQALN
jgi:hypothetical protein